MAEIKHTGDLKLTKARREMLERLVTWGPGPADPSYPPARALLKAGYVTREVRRNKMRLHIFTITEAGRTALSKALGTTAEEVRRG